MDELAELMYSARIDREDPRRTGPDRREVPFAQALLLENLNPRTRLQAGFEWGLPNYMNLALDYEHQIKHNLSGHVGVRRRYTGWSLEPGVRWAFIKSARTETLVTLIGDLRLNTDPAYLAFRPQIGVGKKFGPVDLQGQLGVDLDLRFRDAPRWIGGFSATYDASDLVAVFLEGKLHAKDLLWPEGHAFRFHSTTFGLKFYPKIPDLDPQSVEVNVGATVPVATNYWMFHYGSIMAQVNYYM